MKNNYKRRVYVVNRDFQIKFLLYTIVLAFLIIGTFYGMVHYFFKSSMEFGIEAGFPPGHIYFRFIQDNREDMNVLFFFTSVIVFILIVISGVLFSHKIAGPIFRINNYLKSISLERLNAPMIFRKGDFFKELADSYNERLMFLRNQATDAPDKLINVLKLKEGENPGNTE